MKLEKILSKKFNLAKEQGNMRLVPEAEAERISLEEKTFYANGNVRFYVLEDWIYQILTLSNGYVAVKVPKEVFQMDNMEKFNIVIVIFVLIILFIQYLHVGGLI